MNNRWNEIAYKCWNERKSGRQFDQEMFAELIVRECAKRVDYWESRQGEHTEDLLKHFGVE